MAAFAGSDAPKLTCRQHVTKYLCDYIKRHSLQNSGDKQRFKINVTDSSNEFAVALRKLIRYDEPVMNKKEGKMEDPELTYTSLQRYIGRLLVPAPTPASTPTSTPATVSTPTPTPATPAKPAAKKVLKKTVEAV